MVDDDPGILRAVAWTEVLPWLRISRAFRLAISGRVLVLAALAAAITLSGWALFHWMFSGAPEAVEWMGPSASCPWVVVDQMVPNEPSLPWDRPGTDPEDVLGQKAVPPVRDAFFSSWWQLLQPFWQSLELDRGLTGLACLALCGVWSLATWAFFGGAITRIAALELSCEERIGFMPSLRYACGKWLSFIAAPLFPVFGIALAAIPVALLGLLVRFDVGLLLIGVAWPVALLAGLIMAVLGLGLMFGWPLMFATISTEGTDAFDALSRSYAYVFQRPLRYLFYAIVAAFIGTLSWLLVSNFAAGVVGMTYWAASWGAGADRVTQIIDGEPALSAIGNAGTLCVQFWVGTVKIIALGFLYGFFFCASTAIYLLLRRDVDATEIDEVFLDEDESEQQYGLPPLAVDEAGAPVAEEDAQQSKEESDAQATEAERPPSGA